MTSGWYFAKAGASAGSETGPFAWEELYHLAQTGALQPTDLVWNPKLPRGVNAGLIPGLFPGFEARQLPTIEQPFPQEAMETIPERVVVSPVPAPTPQTGPAQERPTPSAVVGHIDDEVSVDEEPVEPHGRRSNRHKQPKSQGQTSRLPALVVLLVLVIAAAGVAAYFLYFRV
jgi:hypothetical protein